MFSFKAYFFNHDVYINEKYKYAAGEILTAYLNTDFYDDIIEFDAIRVLRRLKENLKIIWRELSIIHQQILNFPMVD